MANSERESWRSQRAMIRGTRTVCATAGLLILVFSKPLPGQKAFAARDYAGDWVRSNQEQNFVVYLALAAEPGSEIISVHAWGRCKRKPEVGGTRGDCEDWGSAKLQLAPSGMASFFQPFLKELWDMHLSDDGGRLWVRSPNSGVAWIRDPGVDLVRHTPPPTPPAATCSIKEKGKRDTSFFASAGRHCKGALVFSRFQVQT